LAATAPTKAVGGDGDGSGGQRLLVRRVRGREMDPFLRQRPQPRGGGCHGGRPAADSTEGRRASRRSAGGGLDGGEAGVAAVRRAGARTTTRSFTGCRRHLLHHGVDGDGGWAATCGDVHGQCRDGGGGSR
jgi:hypothetical protein